MKAGTSLLENGYKHKTTRIVSGHFHTASEASLMRALMLRGKYVRRGNDTEKIYILKYLHEVRLNFMGPTGHRLELNTFKVNILR